MPATGGSRAIQSRSVDAVLRTFSTRANPSGVPEATRALSCPLCGTSLAGKPWKAEGVVFTRCLQCGLRRQDPQPVPEAIVARYGDDYLAYETARHIEYRSIALQSLAEAGLRPGDVQATRSGRSSLLEVGCATGALLSAFEQAGWSVKGVEAGPSMAAYARATFGLDVIAGTVETVALPADAYDAVVATHLIEHLNDPRSFLREARRVMRKEGRLYLVTPNADGLQARLMASRWRSAIRDHLYLFSARTLRAMLASEGFAVEYLGTWGGWPAGMRPLALKKPLDAAAKRLGWGDVMVLRAKIEQPA